MFYGRYLDDGLGLWVHHEDRSEDLEQWHAFQLAMNSYGLLVWDFSPRAQQVHFLDLWLTITPQGVQTRIYEKGLNLYLYIPPHSAHAPGVAQSLVFGMVRRIFTLTTGCSDRLQSCRDLFIRLVARGYDSSTLKGLFRQALSKLEVKDFVWRI